jgi:hypothetical protein
VNVSRARGRTHKGGSGQSRGGAKTEESERAGKLGHHSVPRESRAASLPRRVTSPDAGTAAMAAAEKAGVGLAAARQRSFPLTQLEGDRKRRGSPGRAAAGAQADHARAQPAHTTTATAAEENH